MSGEANNRLNEKVRTSERINSVAARLVVILVLAIVSYDLPVAIATTPVNADASAPGPAPAIRAELPDLPLEVAVVPLKDANGASFKLGDFFGKVMARVMPRNGSMCDKIQCAPN